MAVESTFKSIRLGACPSLNWFLSVEPSIWFLDLLGDGSQAFESNAPDDIAKIGHWPGAWDPYFERMVAFESIGGVASFSFYGLSPDDNCKLFGDRVQIPQPQMLRGGDFVPYSMAAIPSDRSAVPGSGGPGYLVMKSERYIEEGWMLADLRTLDHGTVEFKNIDIFGDLRWMERMGYLTAHWVPDDSGNWDLWWTGDTSDHVGMIYRAKIDIDRGTIEAYPTGRMDTKGDLDESNAGEVWSPLFGFMGPYGIMPSQDDNALFMHLPDEGIIYEVNIEKCTEPIKEMYNNFEDYPLCKLNRVDVDLKATRGGDVIRCTWAVSPHVDQGFQGNECFGESTTEPTTEEPITEEPTTEDPTTEQTTEKPITEEPTTEDPTTEQTTEKPITEEPTTEDPTTEQTTEKPITEEPTASSEPIHISVVVAVWGAIGGISAAGLALLIAAWKMRSHTIDLIEGDVYWTGDPDAFVEEDPNTHHYEEHELFGPKPDYDI